MYISSAIFKLAYNGEQSFHFLFFKLFKCVLKSGWHFSSNGQIGTQLDEGDSFMAIADEENGVLLVELEVGEFGLADRPLFRQLRVFVDVQVVDVHFVQGRRREDYQRGKRGKRGNRGKKSIKGEKKRFNWLFL